MPEKVLNNYFPTNIINICFKSHLKGLRSQFDVGIVQTVSY